MGWRPCPCRSPTPEPGIPSLSPFAVGGQRGFVAGSPPSVPLQPQETRNQKGKTAQLLELQHPRRGVSAPRCPAFLRPRRRVWGHGQRGPGGGGGRGGRGALRGPPRCPNFLEPSGLNPRRRQSPAFSHRGDQRGGNGRPRWAGGGGGARPGRGDSTPGPDTHHAQGPRGTATAPAAPTAERGAGRASSRSPPPPPPPPGQIHMERGSQPRSPHFLLSSSRLGGSRPRAAP